MPCLDPLFHVFLLLAGLNWRNPQIQVYHVYSKYKNASVCSPFQFACSPFPFYLFLFFQNISYSVLVLLLPLFSPICRTEPVLLIKSISLYHLDRPLIYLSSSPLRIQQKPNKWQARIVLCNHALCFSITPSSCKLIPIMLRVTFILWCLCILTIRLSNCYH